jgi:hypothetical protein
LLSGAPLLSEPLEISGLGAYLEEELDTTPSDRMAMNLRTLGIWAAIIIALAGMYALTNPGNRTPTISEISYTQLLGKIDGGGVKSVEMAGPRIVVKDAEGKTIAYSTTGSSTQVMVMALSKMAGVTTKPTATGSPPSTFTQVMSGQVDIGWTAPPLMLDALESGRIRVLAKGDEVPEFRNQPVRVILANAGSLEKNRDAMARYMAAQQAERQVPWSHIARHCLGLWNGTPGARRWRQVWWSQRS